MQMNISVVLVTPGAEGTNVVIAEYGHNEVIPEEGDMEGHAISAAAVIDRQMVEARDSIAVQMRAAIGSATPDDREYIRRRPATRGHRAR